jgi:hypothetical protein
MEYFNTPPDQDLIRKPWSKIFKGRINSSAGASPFGEIPPLRDGRYCRRRRTLQ